jgi:hypothetical protein
MPRLPSLPRIKIPAERQHPHTPRMSHRVSLLPTHDGRELLAHMAAKIGTAETARRLAREPAAIRRWLRGDARVPSAVAHWLQMAAANTGRYATTTIEQIQRDTKWHYPRAKPGINRRQRASLLAIQALIDAEDEATMQVELDPYA